MIPIPIEEIDSPPIHIKDQFYLNVIKNMRDDDIGRAIKKEPIILMLGTQFYARVKRRKSKKDGVVSKVRADMRRLGHLYSRFKELLPNTESAADMFLCSNFITLQDVIESYTDSNLDVQKSGLKSQLYYLLLKSAKKLKGHYMISNEKQKRVETDEFIVLLGHQKDDVFGDATYELNERRNVKTKKPSSLPIEDDIELIRNHILQTMKKYAEDPFHMWDLHSFKELRDSVCARLTIFNGRRGGEPSRLLLREWKEALDGTWLDNQREISNDAGSLITYQNGKGIGLNVNNFTIYWKISKLLLMVMNFKKMFKVLFILT